jgi:hypothetical protein
MAYTEKQFEKAVKSFGEVFFVLDSDREYEVHGERGYETFKSDSRTFVEVEGMQDGEYLVVQFPLDAIEHHYTHREV